MPDMSAEFYLCCGYTVVISGFDVEVAGGQRGRLVHCALCDRTFVVPGDAQAARDVIPDHFLSAHQLKGSLDDWSP
jgi:hypothetical protein